MAQSTIAPAATSAKPAIQSTELLNLEIQCRLVSGFQLASHPHLTTWLVIAPTGSVSFFDEANGCPFVDTRQATNYARRQPRAVREAAEVRAFDEAFVLAV